MKISIYENLFYVFFVVFLFWLCFESASLCRVYDSKRKRAIFVRCFFFLFGCVPLEWHRFEFFMQIEGWWDKNKLYNCRWNGRAAERKKRQKKRKKKKQRIYLLYPMWSSECGWWITSQRFTFKRNEKRTVADSFLFLFFLLWMIVVHVWRVANERAK